MTKEERTAFVKDKLAPLFDGINAGDALEILRNTHELEQAVASKFIFSRCQQKD